uniref:SAM domain-containing protein n=1 Tax=Arcella intermedia TaxID=1963864 RepID=A0A6B2KXZ3_9EUKA
MQALSIALQKNTSLTSLRFLVNNLGDEGGKLLGSALKLNQSITTLQIPNNNISDAGAVGIALGLESNSVLSTLEIGSNRIGDTGNTALAKMLKCNHTLSKLDLTGVSCSAAGIIAESLQCNLGLVSLSLLGEIDTKAAKAFGDMLLCNTTLTKLSLWGNNLLNNEGISELSRGLEHNMCLHTLNIRAAQIGVAGASSVVQMLKINTTLLKLEIVSCNIDDTVAKVFASGLSKNCHLVALNLLSNKIGDDGAIAFSQMLLVNHILNELVLYSNEVNAAGADAIVKALEKNHSMIYLSISNGKYKTETWEKQMEIFLKRNREEVKQLVQNVSNNNVEQVIRLCKKGISPNVYTFCFDAELKQPALHRAVGTGNVEMVKVLLENAANPSLIDENGKRALQLAIEKGKKEIVLLLQKSNNQSTRDVKIIPPQNIILKESLRKTDLAEHKIQQEVKSILEWTKNEVYEYFMKIDDLSAFAQSMLEEDINGKALLLLEESDLKSLGLKLGGIKIFMAERQKLQSPNTYQSSPSVINQPSGNKAREDRHQDQPTARVQPGKRFLEYVPNANHDKNSIIDCLYSRSTSKNHDKSIIDDFIAKIADYQEEGHDEGTALSLALCWLYTCDCWLYKEVNNLLRNDSPSLRLLSPYMKGLMSSYHYLSHQPQLFYHGVVYRRTKLQPKDLEFYKLNTLFVWSAFTSTTSVFDPSASFGDILFVITIPEKFKQYSLNIQSVSDFKSEEEILLLPNIGYKVHQVQKGPLEKYPNTSYIIEILVSYVCIV